jgi:hypothetical protein
MSLTMVGITIQLGWLCRCVFSALPLDVFAITIGCLQRRRNIDNWGGRYSYIRVHRL